MSPGNAAPPGRQDQGAKADSGGDRKLAPLVSVDASTDISPSDFPPLIRRRTAEEEAYYAEVAKFLGQCRRRREGAALRLPPLADGRRDPLESVTDGAACG